MEGTYNEVVRETKIKCFRTVDALDLFRREGDVQCLNVLFEMLDLPSPNDREYVWGLVHDVRDRD